MSRSCGEFTVKEAAGSGELPTAGVVLAECGVNVTVLVRDYIRALLRSASSGSLLLFLLQLHSHGRPAAREPRRAEVLQTVRGRGAELVQVDVDHHPQQNLRRDQVSGRGEEPSGTGNDFTSMRGQV